MKTAEIELPYGLPADCPLAILIRQIGTALAQRGQQLCWFRSQRSSNWLNITVNAGIFPIGVRSSVRSTACIEHVVSWPWTPKLTTTERGRHYRSLVRIFAGLLGHKMSQTKRQAERLAILQRVNNASDFEAEQAAQQGAPGVDIRSDGMPTDAGNVWRMHHHDMTDQDVTDYTAICKEHQLPFERGARAYYVMRDKLVAVNRDLNAAGFIVALDFDAARTLNELTA